jgi:uncharacterized membrane protein
MSLYLAVKNRIVVKSAVAVAVVALVTHQLAQPVRGVGVALPIFIPPIIALVCALVLSWRQAGPLAYVGGSMDTLIGADIMNLGKIQKAGRACRIDWGGPEHSTECFWSGLWQCSWHR